MAPRKDQLPPGKLQGMRIMIPRTPDRAAGMARRLAAEGAHPLLVPLIDFQIPSDPSELDECLGLLSEGRFAWLVITSVTTVRALKQRAESMGRQLQLMIPAATRVAVVGHASRQALIAEGIPVHFLPTGEQSGRSLVEDWPLPERGPAGSGINNRVLVPQSDIASETVATGITERGWQALPVIAYRTVDYPAADEMKITAPVGGAEGGTETGNGRGEPALSTLSVNEFRVELDAGRVDAIILTSPSGARRVAQLGGRLPADVLIVAIGHITADEAALVGLPISAVAAEPSPAGVTEALASARRHLPTEQDMP